MNETSYNAAFSVYPNPTSGPFNLKMNKFEDLKIKNIEIFNVYGAKIFSNKEINFQINPSSNFQIDLSEVPAGVYFLKIIDRDGSSAVKKIIKE